MDTDFIAAIAENLIAFESRRRVIARSSDFVAMFSKLML